MVTSTSTGPPSGMRIASLKAGSPQRVKGADYDLAFVSAIGAEYAKLRSSQLVSPDRIERIESVDAVLAAGD